MLLLLELVRLAQHQDNGTQHVLHLRGQGLDMLEEGEGVDRAIPLVLVQRRPLAWLLSSLSSLDSVLLLQTLLSWSQARHLKDLNGTLQRR